MLAAGLLARNAVQRGLKSKPWVKTSLAPGSKVVIDYYRQAGLLSYLEQLNFHLVGFGCTTCIGNSGPLPDPVAAAVQGENLVVAYALAGRIDIDLTSEPLGEDTNGKPVYLRDIWPSNEEVQRTVRQAVSREMFQTEYAQAFDGELQALVAHARRLGFVSHLRRPWCRG